MLFTGLHARVINLLIRGESILERKTDDLSDFSFTVLSLYNPLIVYHPFIL
jgi:hypothetical protein